MELMPDAKPKPLKFRVEDVNDGHRLTVFDPVEYLETETTIVEGIVFNSVADLLKYVHLNHPSAREVED